MILSTPLTIVLPWYNAIIHFVSLGEWTTEKCKPREEKIDTNTETMRSKNKKTEQNKKLGNTQAEKHLSFMSTTLQGNHTESVLSSPQ